jgi:fibrillarin-like pre-rRNA processing protein
VDVTKNPKDIFRKIRSELEKEMIIVDYRELDPFEKDHAFFVVKKK